MADDMNPPGSFCWVELGTSDPDAARKFYSGLFGWTIAETPMPGGPPYVRFQRGGRDAAAMYAVDPELPGARSDSWSAYVAVDDVDAASARVGELGGKVTAGPFDVPDSGRMSVCQDPGGAVFSLWQAGATSGVGVRSEPGSICWVELLTDAPDEAAAFYMELFGWARVTTDLAAGPYTSFLKGDAPCCGMMEMNADWGTTPPHWVIYFAVDDTDAAVARTSELGGSIVVAATDVPDVGRFAWLGDPSGAVFGVMALSESD